jgi:4-hydroxy-3-methylbut-2-en-1-yl diphosphate reductase
MQKKLIVASPRGFCAGVTRAVEVVQKALDLWGSPIYVKHEIVHNQFVVDQLRDSGAVFVEELEEVPAGSHVIFSAHGVPPSAFKEAKDRGLLVTDATCPLVTKVHKEARRYADQGCEILLIGHREHVEAIGTCGVAPKQTRIIQTREEAEAVEVTPQDAVAVLTQTTLSVDDAKEIQEVLQRRFGELKTPTRSDICYATTNRQTAIKEICQEVELVLVVGSRTSSNSNRLCEVAKKAGVEAYLIGDETEIDPRWLNGVHAVGMTAGASTPEEIIERCIQRLGELGIASVQEKEIVSEQVSFNLPQMTK